MNNTELYNHVKDLIDIMRKSVNANIKATADITNLRIDEVIKRQEKTNGNVNRNTEKIECIEKQTRFMRWIHRNPHWAIPLFIIIAFGIYFILTYLGIEYLFNL